MAQASEMAQSTVDLVMPFSWISIPTPKCPVGWGRWVESFPPLYTKETNVTVYSEASQGHQNLPLQNGGRQIRMRGVGVSQTTCK